MVRVMTSMNREPINPNDPAEQSAPIPSGPFHANYGPRDGLIITQRCPGSSDAGTRTRMCAGCVKRNTPALTGADADVL